MEVGINRKPICYFLLVINSNWHLISYRFGLYRSLLFTFWTPCVFEPPFGRLRDNVPATYDVYLELIAKRVVLLLIELLSLVLRLRRYGRK